MPARDAEVDVLDTWTSLTDGAVSEVQVLANLSAYDVDIRFDASTPASDARVEFTWGPGQVEVSFANPVPSTAIWGRAPAGMTAKFSVRHA